MPSVCIRVVAGNPQRSPGVFVSLARAALVAMRAHPQSPPLKRAGCEALVHIARTGQAAVDKLMAHAQERLQRVPRENEAAREEIARLKAGLEACKDAPRGSQSCSTPTICCCTPVQTLRSSTADEVATARALTQLRLGCPPESQMLLLKAGVPRLLLGALWAHPRSALVAVSALRAIPLVCVRVKTPDVFVSLARAALVAMRAHPQSCPVQQAGCEALVHIAGTGQAVREVCVAEGAVECVASALSLSQKLGPLELPAAACEALAALCPSSPSARERVVALGALGTLVRMAGGGEMGGQVLGPMELRLFSAAVFTLCQLAQHGRDLLDPVVSSGALRALLLSPAIAQLEPSVAAYLCRTVNALARSPERGAYEEERCLAVGAVVLVLRKFGGRDRDAEFAAIKALSQLAKLVVGPHDALGSRLLQPDVGQALAEVKGGTFAANVRKCLRVLKALRRVKSSAGPSTTLQRRLHAAEAKAKAMELAQERLQRVARENEAAREEIAMLKAGLEACKDAPERLAELQHAYDLLLHAFYSC
eukprot:m51a1_g14595 hypothetical protein (537) ;mRNA; r:1161551-1164924